MDDRAWGTKNNDLPDFNFLTSSLRCLFMKPPFTLGVVGHFGVAVRNPKQSAQWFQRVLGLRKEFEFEDGVAVGNENVTIVLFKGRPSPETIGHMYFTCRTWPHCERHLPISRGTMLIWRTRATRSVRKRPAHPTWDFGFTISTAIAGSCQSKGENDLRIQYLEHRREKTAVGALRINVAWLQIRHLSTINSWAHCRVICDRVNKLFSVSLLLCFIVTGCLTKSTSNSGGIGGTKVQSTNPSAIIAAARTVFAQSGYTIGGVDYPSTISFDKPAGKLGELIYGSYGVTTTVRVKL